MMKFFPFAMITVLFFTSCSMKTPPNQWEHKAKNATQSYIKNYLSDKELLAQKDFQRAVEHAKQSANLSILGKVYLTKCAMDKIVNEEKTCKEYQEIETLIIDPELQSYRNFLVKKLTLSDIKFLNEKYHSFATYYLNNQYEESIRVLLKTNDVVSMLIMTSLVQDKLSQDDITQIIHLTSFYGYKKATKHWLEYKAIKFDDLKSKEILKVMEN